MAIKFGTSAMKEGYVGTNRIKHIYLDKTLVFSALLKLTFTLDAGIAAVDLTCTRIDGAVSTYSVTNSQDVAVPYGSKLSMTATAKTGYSLNGYTSGIASITADRTLTYSTTVNKYWTNVNLNYSGTEYGNSVGNLLGTYQYSYNGTTWYGPLSNEPTSSPWSEGLDFGSYVYIRSITPGAGFRVSSVTYNGVIKSPLNGIYSIQIEAGNFEINISFTSSTTSSAVSYNYAESITTNTLSRYNWTVSCSINIHVSECTAGTVIGRVPYQYRPAAAKTFTTDWMIQSGTAPQTTQATITVNTDGSIVSNTDSTGHGSASGGGKWGGYSVAWYTQIAGSLSWSVK